MKKIEDIYRENLSRLVQEFGGVGQLAQVLERASSQVSQWKNGSKDSKTGKPRSLDRDSARYIEVKTGKPDGWMDTEHSRLSPFNAEDAPELVADLKIPVVGEVQGGDDGYLDEFAYPLGQGDGYVLYPSKDKNAFALRVRGESMHPRYRSGEFVIVEPSIEPQPGEDVVVSCKQGRKMLKVFNWKRDNEVQLLSINNGFAPITLRLDEIESIYLVSGRALRRAFNKN